MSDIRLLQNPVQHYAWGSYTAIPELLGWASPADKPCAELWMGAHPKASSRVIEDQQAIPLGEWIQTAPEKILGKRAAASFGAKLPFLFKVLAAEQPLSLQAHPDHKKAHEGFIRENRAGIPLDAPERNFKDAGHKPECICALTSFSGLCGFRDISGILSNLSLLFPGTYDQIASDLIKSPTAEGLRNFVSSLLFMDKTRAASLVTEGVAQAGALREQDPLFEWIVLLNRHYPGDIMVLAPAFLNIFHLHPGQALFLPPGVLHSYFYGTGIETMANSDNVLRGGLTSKHVEPETLLEILAFSEMLPRILTPAAVSACENRYSLETEEFELSHIQVKPHQKCRVCRTGNIEIFLCVSGSGEILETDANEVTAFGRGTSFLIPADAGTYFLSGEAVLYKATVPA